MTLQQRINLLVLLGEYIKNNEPKWQKIKEDANRINPWFVPDFIEMATSNICNNFLQRDKLDVWVKTYKVPEFNTEPATVGLVMAGNIPLVGFHDFICLFITGHRLYIKPSSKDELLIKHLVEQMSLWDNNVLHIIQFAENLKHCDAYIATGSNTTSRYFEHYFGKFPHIIRKNRTSIAILDGSETTTELELLADDMLTYFGLGCRNVTKIYVPDGYNFEALLSALNKYQHYADFHKYKNNYDYQLALMMMSNKFYMTNGTVLLTKNESFFTAISQLHYDYYSNKEALKSLSGNEAIQCIVGHNAIPFGKAQIPTLTDYADGTDTMWFAMSL